MNQPDRKRTDTEHCGTCKFHVAGTSHGYNWRECSKNWSDSRQFIGVIRDICNKFTPKK